MSGKIREKSWNFEVDDKWQPYYNGSLIHTQTHTHIHTYNLMLNGQNNMIIHVIVFLVIVNSLFQCLV